MNQMTLMHQQSQLIRLLSLISASLLRSPAVPLLACLAVHVSLPSPFLGGGCIVLSTSISFFHSVESNGANVKLHTRRTMRLEASGSRADRIQVVVPRKMPRTLEYFVSGFLILSFVSHKRRT